MSQSQFNTQSSTPQPVAVPKLSHPATINKRDRDWNKPYGGALCLGFKARAERERIRLSGMSELEREATRAARKRLYEEELVRAERARIETSRIKKALDQPDPEMPFNQA